MSNSTHFSALVAGPDRLDTFSDDRADISSTLVGLHFNAPLQILLVRQVVYSTVSPNYFGVVSNNGNGPANTIENTASSGDRGFPSWAIGLIVALGVIFL